MPLSLSDYRITGVYLSPVQQLQIFVCVCVCMYTSYEEGRLQSNMGPSEAMADTFVGPGVSGFDLGDQQRAVGEENHSVERKQIKV